MGIPAFFRQIIENYKTTHKSELKTNVDYFFIDFNSIIYDTYNTLDMKKDYGTLIKFENFLISEIINKIKYIIVDLIQPSKLLYIALDGTAPRAKMIQQRRRRYNGVKFMKFKNTLKEKYGIEKNLIDWEASANISPGTKFMKKLSKALKIKIPEFKNMNKDLKIIISDGNVPGEGEHKFLHYLRQDLKGKNDTVVIYSPDADVIVLSMATHKNNIYILRKVKETNDATNVEKQYILCGKKYLFLSIDEYRSAFIEKLELDESMYDNIRLITDYVFLTFFGGNDFVTPIPYLKVKEERKDKNSGLGILLNIYKKLLPNYDYLINIKNNSYIVNHLFLKEIFEEIVKSEDYYMRGIQIKINNTMQGKDDERKLKQEEDKSPYEKELMRYEHYEYYNQLHPEYSKYKDIFKKFNFFQPKQMWKPIYYNHFFYLDSKNIIEYNKLRNEICKNYLESIMFTMKYYFEGVPSWSWYYRFRAPPLASDILDTLNKDILNINDIKFIKDVPYKPFDQLMMILPINSNNLLPKCYQNLMNTSLIDYYPIDFELDVFLGQKYIYSEPILPDIDDNRVMKETISIENKLTKEEIERNINIEEEIL